MIGVVATIEVAQGKKDQFLDLFRRLVPKVREEDGCLEYIPSVDAQTQIEAQAAPRDHVVTVLEKWRDLPALEKHLAAPHMKQYRESVKELVVKLTLHIYEPV